MKRKQKANLFLASLLRVVALASNVSRTREVVKPANRVVSAKIEFIRGNRAEATQNQQFLVTAVTGCIIDYRVGTIIFNR